jgi:hypothetical protein
VKKEPTDSPSNAFAEPEWTFLFCAKVRMSHDAYKRITKAENEFLVLDQ